MPCDEAFFVLWLSGVNVRPRVEGGMEKSTLTLTLAPWNCLITWNASINQSMRKVRKKDQGPVSHMHVQLLSINCHIKFYRLNATINHNKILCQWCPTPTLTELQPFLCLLSLITVTVVAFLDSVEFRCTVIQSLMYIQWLLSEWLIEIHQATH